MVHINDLQNLFGVQQLSDAGYLTFRCYAGNLLVGGHGVRKIEIFGAEGTGKSTLLYEILGIAASDSLVFLGDQEKAATHERLAKFGLFAVGNPFDAEPNIVVGRASNIEEYFENLHLFMEKTKSDPRPVIIATDSVGMLIPGVYYAKHLYEKDSKAPSGFKETTEKTAATAKAWARVLRWFNSHYHSRDVTNIFLNHQTDVIDTTPWGAKGPKKVTSPGGNTMKHAVFTRIKCSVIRKIKHNDVIIGNEVILETIKCKDAPPFQKVRLPLYFGNPTLTPDEDFAGTYDPIACLFHLQDRGVIKKSGGWSTLRLNKEDGSEELVKWQGEAGWRANVWPAWQTAIYNKMLQCHYAPTVFNPGM